MNLPGHVEAVREGGGRRLQVVLMLPNGIDDLCTVASPFPDELMLVLFEMIDVWQLDIRVIYRGMHISGGHIMTWHWARVAEGRANWTSDARYM